MDHLIFLVHHLNMVKPSTKELKEQFISSRGDRTTLGLSRDYQVDTYPVPIWHVVDVDVRCLPGLICEPHFSLVSLVLHLSVLVPIPEYPVDDELSGKQQESSLPYLALKDEGATTHFIALPVEGISSGVDSRQIILIGHE
ncbi:MAG TPA: hypothetical protein VFH06_01100 [Candidatus Saccharimonadales bacterium]|nr:hypothetical protein [Candidatus Saccharimonadales bacterium]